MHPLRRLRESGKPTAAQVSELLAENIVFNSPILVRPIAGREVVAAIFAQSSATRGSGTYAAEFKLDERTTFWRWVGTMDGHKFESLEVIVDNEQGLIVERTIALSSVRISQWHHETCWRFEKRFATTPTQSGQSWSRLSALAKLMRCLAICPEKRRLPIGSRTGTRCLWPMTRATW